MGKSKTTLFTAQQNRLAELAKAIGHPARIAILEFLSQQSGCVCRDIVDELPLSQSTVSQHLKALKAVGIIEGNVEGVSVCYCIDLEVWQEAVTLISGFMANRKCC